MNQIRILSGADVDKALPMTDAIEAMADAFRQLSSGAAQVPLRQHLAIGDGEALVMPVHLPGTAKIGVKVVTVFAGNPARGLPLIHGLVMVFDGSDGRPLALIDGERLTAIRTGAAAGLATRLFSRETAKTLAIFGAGVQGRAQLTAVRAVRPIERLLLYSANPKKTESFLAEIKTDTGLTVEVNPPRRRLREADIICTATTASSPVFEDSELGVGAHINGIGAYRPDSREIPGETVARARLIVDQREACRAEAGDLILAIRDGLIPEDCRLHELGALIEHGAPKEWEHELTLFKSVGNAAQDLAAAARALENAAAQGLGVLARL